MDYFRDGELSTSKEKKVLEMFDECNNQVILTATLKDEEIGKYDGIKGINHINYMNHKPYKLLNPEYLADFNSIIKKFKVLD